LGIFEIILFLVIALIVIPPDDLPQVMRAAGKILRELRLASNTVMREISGALGDDTPFNILPPRFDDPHPPIVPPEKPTPPAQAFLGPEQPLSPPDGGQGATTPEPAAAEPAAPATAANTRTGGELHRETSTPVEPPTPPSQPEAPEHPGSVPPADKP
jgi:sec-independent protein translocase protein TatB